MNFDVSSAVRVYILYDDRATSIPGWLTSYTLQAFSVTANFQTFNVYAKTFPAGTITLGGNAAPTATGAATNYSVVVGFPP